MKEDTDDEPLSFVSLAALTANVTRYLKIDEQKPEHSTERERDDEAKKREVDRLEFVNRGGRN